ncbi:receptor-like protein 6 [Pistacia vera]|uniref:receptor-like protein 6 n=1 Tax=Pistacia vera TaxID=55513 RepID=UPI0012638F3F|nr:receptor-like protein 6 [Pistacia vera]
MGLSLCFFSFICLLLWLSLFHLTLLPHFTSSVKPHCHDDERSSLLQFKESLIINKFASSDPSAYPKLASWKANDDCCSWDGVTCNKVTGHLIGLDLTNSCLYGSINSSSSLFHLVHLEWLILGDNDFNGSKIPSEIKNLSRLSCLDLYNSSFSGQIPWEVLELSNLETLDLTFNFNLKIQKPSLRSLVEKLTHLKVLYLGHVNISSPIPDILTNLSSLTALSLKGCQLQGKFPTKIFQLPNLRILSMRFNPNLSGSLPEFEKNSPLEELRVEQTRFSGEIPYSIGNLNSLQILDMSNCSFWGSIPPSLGNLTKITLLYLNRNEFSGKLPATIGNLASLEELNLSYNNFSSQDFRSLSWMAKCSKLTFLELSQINLYGEIPYWLMSLTQVTYLSVSHNELNGTIPSQIRNLTKLKHLALDSNQLQGPFPSALYDLETLQELNLGSNNLSGIVDMNMLFYQLQNLESLSLSSSHLQLLTEIDSHTKVPKFRILELGSCNLTEFSNFLQNQDQLTELHLSSNKIAGRIPGWFLKLSSLQTLDVSNNLLTGFD